MNARQSGDTPSAETQPGDTPSGNTRPPQSAGPPLLECLRAAVLTPAGRGAVAVVRVTGSGAASIVGRHFEAASQKPLDASPPGRIVFGKFRPSAAAEQAEELVVVVRSSYDVEIQGHGGKAAVETILQTLAGAGCRLVDWREMIATVAGDQLAAEATVALAEARTMRAAAVLVDQLAGALRRAVDEVRRILAAGDPAAALSSVDRLLRFAPLGLRLTEPFRVTLAGRPNVGKSSLLNALVGYSRAIVFDEPGTTRDVVTAVTAIDGWLVELADTAGRRASHDPLESAGIRRAVRQSETDDLTVLVCDFSTSWTDDDDELLANIPTALVVHNKCDLETAHADGRPPGLAVSAATGQGLPELQAVIAANLVPDPPQPGQAVPFTTRQIEALVAVRVALQSGDLPRAMTALRGLNT